MPISRLALALACAAFVIHDAAHAMAATARSTPIEGKQCKTVSHDRETGDTVKRCPGVSGYSLLVHHSDDRASISIVTKDDTTLPLNFWETVTPTFSTLGAKVEWQIESSTGTDIPVAIIVRVNTVDQADVSKPRPVSLIVVARILPGHACVIGKIPAQKSDADRAARALARTPDAKCIPQIR